MGALDSPRTLRRPVAWAALPTPVETPARRVLRVGLLGGSFNPAHDGHRYVSIEALRRLRLDQVWWLVSPQNPLKAGTGMAPLAARVEAARQVARHPRIKVDDLERRLGTRYTVDTLERLVRWPGYRFVWLIGADNLAQLPRWRRWTRLAGLAPIAVFERHPYSYASLAGAAAVAMGGRRIDDAAAGSLIDAEPPAWTFMRLRPHPASATDLRRQGRWAA